MSLSWTASSSKFWGEDNERVLDRVIAGLIVVWIYMRVYGGILCASLVLLVAFSLIARVVGAAL